MKWIAGLLALAFVAGVAAFLARAPHASETVTVTTENLPELLPHFHGPSDKVDDPHHGVEVASAPVEIPEDMWVTELSLGIRNAPQDVIHHLYLYKMTDAGNIPLATLGQDTLTAFRFPKPAGIFLAKGTRVILYGLLHNAVPPEGPGGIYKDVTLSVTLSGFPPGAGRDRDIAFGLLTLSDATSTPPGTELTFTVPPQTETYVRTSAMSAPGAGQPSYVFPADGWIVHMGGHTHAWQGGREIDAFLNGALVTAYRSHPEDAKKPWSWKTDAGASYIRVRKGDVLTLSASYTNPSTDPIAGAMGLLGFFFVPDRFSLTSGTGELAWPLKSFIYPWLERIGIWPQG